MGFRRYVAPTAREALERIRKELGSDAVILSNRRAGPNKVEIIAAASGQMQALVDGLEVAEPPPPPRRTPAAAPARRVAPETFQEFIRRQTAPAAPPVAAVAMYHEVAGDADDDAPVPRRLPERAAAAAGAEPPAVFRRRPSRLDAARAAVVPAAVAPVAVAPVAVAPASVAPVAAAVSVPLPAAVPVPAAAADAAPAAVIAPAPAPAIVSAPPAAIAAAPAAAVAPAVPAVPPDALASVLQGAAAVAPLPDSRLMAELHSLRSALSDRISNLEVRLAAKPAAVPAIAAGTRSGAAAPARQAVMTRLIMSGFSPDLARRVGDAAPQSLEARNSDAWLQQVISQHVRCPADVDNPVQMAGALALVGPTGVGKTTTMAKIAARFVVRHGAGALGLVTLDSYRMGAHEQLRGYGRILGVPVHMAHDAASLRDLLSSMHGRRQVLIDTCGMSQRDPRLADMLGMLDEVRFGDQPVKRVLLINAASHAETLDEVARGWRVEAAQGAILTKIDEAARIGGALDALLRFQTPLLGLTNGQRVPEDWHPGNPPLLAHIALKPFGAAFSLDSEDLQALARPGALLA